MAGKTMLTIVLLIIFVVSHGAEEATELDDGVTDRFSLLDLFNPSSQIECISRSSQPGFCVPLRQCPVLLAQVRHQNPGRVFQYLEEYTFPCVIRGQVCCPEKTWSHPGKGWTHQTWSWPKPAVTTPTIPRWPQTTSTTTRRPHHTTQWTTRPTFTEPPRTTKHPKKTNKETTHSPFESIKTKHKNRRLLPEDICGIDLGHRVLGGTETELQEHPWLALLQMRLKSGRSAFICGGSLISSRYVLTAAHCMTGTGVPTGAIIDMVRVGEHNTNNKMDCSPGGECNSPPQDIPVEKKIVHPEFTPNDPGTYNDIALLRLKWDVKFNLHVQPICLPFDRLSVAKYDGKKLTTVGWGKTSNAAKSNSPVKLKVDVPIVPTSVCAPQYRARKVNLRDTQICAGGEHGRDSCQGDSGGPLMSHDMIGAELRWHIQGIVSTGPMECGKEGNPAIYTKVNKYLDWILDNISD